MGSQVPMSVIVPLALPANVQPGAFDSRVLLGGPRPALELVCQGLPIRRKVPVLGAVVLGSEEYMLPIAPEGISAMNPFGPIACPPVPVQSFASPDTFHPPPILVLPLASWQADA